LASAHVTLAHVQYSQQDRGVGVWTRQRGACCEC